MKKIICISLFTVFAFSQPPGGPPEDHKKARMMKKWKLIEYLDLNEEQSEKFFIQLNAFQKEIKTVHKKNKKLREDIHDMLEVNRVKDKKVDELIDEYFNNESEILELRHTHHKKIGDVLTSEQTVKYLIFDHMFKKRMKDQLLDKRSHRRPEE
jgi:Spy/CpxP family protein refolding chaperone